MKLDLHTHMNGNGPQNRLDNVLMLVNMAKALRYDGLMLGCHDWVCPPEMANFVRERHGLTVVRGAEVTTDAGHMLALNIPEITPPIHGRNSAPVNGERAIEEIHRLGGKAILSHPFPQGVREYPFPNRLQDVWDMIDGVELHNYKALLRHNLPVFDWFEPKKDWILTSDSDCHPWEGDLMHADFVTDIDVGVFGDLV